MKTPIGARKTVAALGAVAIAGTGLAFIKNTAQTEPAAMTITATVDQAPNLFDGGRVMVRGVEVGIITEVEPQPDGVEITMDIDEGVPIPADASLSVIPITIIADRYVQLTPYDGGPEMRDGAHIPLERTTIPAELDEVLGELKQLVDALKRNPGEKRGPLADLIQAADNALEGKTKSLAGALENSSAVLVNLAGSQTDITKLIQNLDRVFIALADSSSEIGLINERFALVATALADDQDNLEGVIENLEFLSTQAASLVIESGDDLGASFGKLEKTLDVLLEHQDELTKGVKWTNSIAQAVGETDSSGRGRYAYSGLQARPGQPRAQYNYRIDQRDTISCERLGALVDSFLILNPEWGVEEVLHAAMDYIPDEFDDDLEWLIRSLIEPCSVLGDNPALDARAMSLLVDLVDRLGEDVVMEMLGQWFMHGFQEESP